MADQSLEGQLLRIEYVAVDQVILWEDNPKLNDIGGLVQTILGADSDVAVVAQGRHLCMEMRGVRTAGVMTTSVMRGAFKNNPELRQEFLDLVAQGRSV